MGRQLFLFLILPLITSCLFDSQFKKIDENFEVGYVNMPTNRNVYCMSQGIFHNEYVTAINWNDSFIVVKTSDYFTKTHKGYYSINKKKYLEDHYNNSIENAAIESLQSEVIFNEKCETLGINAKFKYTWE